MTVICHIDTGNCLGVWCNNPTIGLSLLADVVRASGGGCVWRSGALGECALLVLARRSASLPWRRLSIIVNKNDLNEQNADKIITVLNKFSYYAKGREAAEEAHKAIAERAKVKVDG